MFFFAQVYPAIFVFLLWLLVLAFVLCSYSLTLNFLSVEPVYVYFTVTCGYGGSVYKTLVRHSPHRHRTVSYAPLAVAIFLWVWVLFIFLSEVVDIAGGNSSFDLYVFLVCIQVEDLRDDYRKLIIKKFY